jgi:ribosomal-protein-alanine N-acetyltransferase
VREEVATAEVSAREWPRRCSVLEPNMQPDPNDVLAESARLLMRRPCPGDEPGLERVFCDPEMMLHLGGVWTADKVADALQEWRDDWGVGQRWSGVLVRRDSREPIGTAGLTRDTVPGEPGMELSWFVLPAHQGRGFATEISEALVRIAFEGLGAARVVAETHPDNAAANRVLEKLGFTSQGERHHSYDYLPGFETQVLWALERERRRPRPLPPAGRGRPRES